MCVEKVTEDLDSLRGQMLGGTKSKLDNGKLLTNHCHVPLQYNFQDTGLEQCKNLLVVVLPCLLQLNGPLLVFLPLPLEVLLCSESSDQSCQEHLCVQNMDFAYTQHMYILVGVVFTTDRNGVLDCHNASQEQCIQS